MDRLEQIVCTFVLFVLVVVAMMLERNTYHQLLILNDSVAAIETAARRSAIEEAKAPPTKYPERADWEIDESNKYAERLIQAEITISKGKRKRSYYKILNCPTCGIAVGWEPKEHRAEKPIYCIKHSKGSK